MRHKLFNLATALSLGLFLAICVLWVRSYFVWDQIRISGDRRWDVIVAHGVLSLSVESKFSGQVGNYNYKNVRPGDRLWLGTKDGRTINRFLIPISESRQQRGVLGFSAEYDDSSSGEGLFSSVRTVRRNLTAPMWFVALVVAAPLIIVVRRARMRHLLRGKCHTCGYDLRGTPDRCPECGTVATSAASKERKG